MLWILQKELVLPKSQYLKVYKHYIFGDSRQNWRVRPDTGVVGLELYFVANGVTEAEQKRAVLLTVSGPSTYKLIRNLTAPEKPAEVAYSEIVALVKAHHTPSHP